MDYTNIIAALRTTNTQVVLSALNDGMSPNLSLAEALAFGGFEEGHKIGPSLLYLATLSPQAAVLVPEMIRCGGEAKRKWVYKSDWDPQDCYYSTKTVSLLRSIRAFSSGAKDYFLIFYNNERPSYALNKKLREMGYFDSEGRPLYSPPTAQVVDMLST